MAGLTPLELSMLQLGFVVRNEEQQEGSRRSQSMHRTHSDSYQARKQDLKDKYIH